MKKILILLLLLVNLHAFVSDDGLQISCGSTACAQHMTTEAESYDDFDLPFITYQCVECGEKFLSQMRLEYHKYHECLKFCCKYECGQRFRDELALERHYKYDCPLAMYDEENRTDCRYCKTQFSSASERQDHEKSCPDKSSESSLQWKSPPVGCNSCFQIIPEGHFESKKLSSVLSNLAFIEYAQPYNHKSQKEINEFRTICNNTPIFETAHVFYSTIGVNYDASYSLETIPCDNCQDISYGRVAICFDRNGNVLDCIIGYKRCQGYTEFLTLGGISPSPFIGESSFTYTSRIPFLSSIAYVEPYRLKQAILDRYKLKI